MVRAEIAATDASKAQMVVIPMTAKTPAERKANERQRRSGAGLVRLEIYAHPEDHASIKEHAAKLQRKRDKFNSKPTNK